MPISKPYPDRSIAPDALAFDATASRGASVIATYQSELAQYVNITQTVVVTDNAYVDRKDREQMVAVGDAERRAKHWVGDYERVFEWDLSADLYVSTNTNDPVAFNHEVIRTMGCELLGTVSTVAAQWRYVCPADAEGQYWIYAYTLMAFTVLGMGVTKANMSVFVNGIQRRVIDHIDGGYAGENPIVDCKLKGGCHTPLKAGDILTIVIRITAANTVDVLLPYPASCYGYVTGHRTRCDMDDVDSVRNGSNIAAPATGSTYLLT